MQRYRNHPIVPLALPAPGKLWRPIGLVFDSERPAEVLKLLECTEVVSMSSNEAEEIALTLAKAWVDGLGSSPDKSN